MNKVEPLNNSHRVLSKIVDSILDSVTPLTKATYLMQENIATQKEKRKILKQTFLTSLLETSDIKMFKAGRILVENQISDRKSYETFIAVTDIHHHSEVDRLDYLKRLLQDIKIRSVSRDVTNGELQSMYSIAREEKMNSKNNVLFCCLNNRQHEKEEFHRFHISEKSYVFEQYREINIELCNDKMTRGLQLALLQLRDGAGASVIHLAYLSGQYEIAHYLLENYPELCQLKYEMVIGGEEDPRVWPYLGMYIFRIVILVMICNSYTFYTWLLLHY